MIFKSNTHQNIITKVMLVITIIITALNITNVYAAQISQKFGNNENKNINYFDDNDTGGNADVDYRFAPTSSSPSLPFSSENFILTDYLTDGELERRISYNGITAKETSIGYNSSDLLSLWQISDGKRFIQLIYSNGRDLIDCEYINQKSLTKKFLNDFYIEFKIAKSRNFTSSSSSTSPLTMRSMYIKNNKNSHQGHQYNSYDDTMMLDTNVYDDDSSNKENLKDSSDSISNYKDLFGMRNLHYQQINNYDEIPDDIKHLLNYNELKLQCFQRHKQMKIIINDLNSKDENIRRIATQSINRQKRDLSDWLIAPNTKWCGKGHSAGKYNQLGGASTADKCCRKHDHCKLNIPGLTTKWQVFNYFPFTVSHCNCDMRFRTCLKMADSSDANMVGKLFFNIVQTKCFVLKTEKVCKKRSWWGKCEKRVKRKRAHLRDNRKF